MTKSDKKKILNEFELTLDAIDRACNTLDTNTPENLICENIYRKLEIAADKIRKMEATNDNLPEVRS